MTIDDLRFSSISQVQDQYLNPKVPKADPKNAVPTGEGSFASIRHTSAPVTETAFSARAFVVP